MQGKMRSTIGVICVAMTLSACDRDRVPELLHIRSDGPDEFAILPNKPLQAPTDYTALPQPTPGGANLVDPTPKQDAVAALGGSPARMQRNNASAGDGAILAHTTRFGRAGGIRESLASADEDYRRQNDGRLLERWFNVNIYYDAYAPQSLDAYRELERFRRLGVRTPSAPPPIEE
ncbi:DUF3035 domain-containing protein [Cognatishimia sp. MH4019]|uniref:DUF3035 domain-containing protein n=1 Tax=Cognatishimia sp. MH4019 TaxID=2854030 RepID=UPI001CD810E1|nr:DUF3035 domain-containing protein [Cognatishimia sp. MH4019]